MSIAPAGTGTDAMHRLATPSLASSDRRDLLGGRLTDEPMIVTAIRLACG